MVRFGSVSDQNQPQKQRDCEATRTEDSKTQVLDVLALAVFSLTGDEDFDTVSSIKSLRLKTGLRIDVTRETGFH